jgi:predicted DNA-binding protein with PD1-like motif
MSVSLLATLGKATDPGPHIHSEEVEMRSKLLHRDGGATYALVFDPGDEVISGLTAFAKDHGLDASDFTALGAFSSALLGFFDVEQKEYQKIPVNQQVEVLTLVGNITLDKQEPKVHAHAVLGCADGTTRGGHLLEGHARPTLELILTEAPVQLRRRFNPSAGLALIDL